MKRLAPLTAISMALSLTACSFTDGNGNSPSKPSPVITKPKLTATKLNSTQTLFDTKKVQESPFVKERTKGNALTQVKLTVNGKEHPLTLDLMSLPTGTSTLEIDTTAQANDNGDILHYSQGYTLKAHKQANSVVAGRSSTGEDIRRPSNGSVSGTAPLPFLSNFTITGNATDNLPTASTINYAGKSFDHQVEGTFKYSIDFGKKEGSGSINLAGETIDLPKAQITKLTNQQGFTGYGIQPTKKSYDFFEDKEIEVPVYTLGIFGKNAEEVAGTAKKSNGFSVGFTGSKQ